MPLLLDRFHWSGPELCPPAAELWRRKTGAASGAERKTGTALRYARCWHVSAPRHTLCDYDWRPRRSQPPRWGRFLEYLLASHSMMPGGPGPPDSGAQSGGGEPSCEKWNYRPATLIFLVPFPRSRLYFHSRFFL